MERVGVLFPPFSLALSLLALNHMQSKVILYGVILTFFCLAGKCQDKTINTSQNENTVVVKIEFITLTRGYQKQVFISPDSLVKITDGRQKNHEVVKAGFDEGRWKELVSSLNNIPLQEIPDLPSPTSKRAFDGAMHSSITIHTKGGESYIHAFDDQNPHKKLQPLMALIKKIAGTD